MSGSTNVENKNNAYIVFMDVEPKEKGKNSIEIVIGKHGEKGQDGDYEIKVSKGKVLTSDDKAKRRISKYTKSLEKMIKKYENREEKLGEDEISK